MTTNTIEVSFPGGKRVDAKVGDFLIQTDQSIKAGGDASAPEPFALFLASLASCAGIFALGFCQARKLDTTDLGLSMDCTWDPVRKIYGQISIKLTVPTTFPDKYRDSLIKAVDLCAVKRHIMEPPKFDVYIQN